MPDTFRGTVLMRRVLHYFVGAVFGALAIYYSVTESFSGLLSKSYAPQYWQPLVGALLIGGALLLVRDAWKPTSMVVVSIGYGLPAMSFFLISQLYHF
jgi:H+/Cl- antiporter ClcA